MSTVKALDNHLYGTTHLAYFFRSAWICGQVTSNSVVYHYLNSDSRQFRTVVLFRDTSHTDEMLDQARDDVLARDPNVNNVAYFDYAYPSSFHDHELSIYASKPALKSTNQTPDLIS
jgi:hypothetical protein